MAISASTLSNINGTEHHGDQRDGLGRQSGRFLKLLVHAAARTRTR